MGRLYIVRHAQTEANAAGILQGPRIDTDLSPVGQQQAAALGQALSGMGLDVLMGSPMQRARQTAQAIGDARDPRLALQVVPEYYEFDYGNLIGQPMEQVQNEVEQIFDAWQMGYPGEAFPGGESALVAQHRIRPLAKRLLENSVEEDVCMVGHGRVNRILLATMLGKGLSSLGEFPQSNAGITELRVEEDQVVLVRSDDTSHLDMKGPQDIS